MDKTERDRQIKIALSHLKLELKTRGDDPRLYNEKYLIDKATAIIDGWAKENPGQLAYVPLKGDE